MPKAHQRYANMTPASLIKMAARIGVSAATLIARRMRERPHPEQGYRFTMGIIALARRTSAVGWRRPVRGRSPSTRSITPP
jgi:transposase